MKLLLFPLLMLSYFISAQTSVPESAQPLYAFEVVSTGFSTVDTFFRDDPVLDTVSQLNWNPIYHVSRFVETGDYRNGFPKLVGYDRKEGQITYFREINFFTDRQGVMYDYNVVEGDSIWILAPQANPLLLDSLLYVIDSVTYSNCSHSDSVKIVHSTAMFNYPTSTGTFYSDKWIEGIGSVFHGFFPVACIEEGSGDCEKFYRNQYVNLGGEWINARTVECDKIPTSTYSHNELMPRIFLYPNPVSTGVDLTLTVSQGTLLNYQIIDFTGKIISSKEVNRSLNVQVSTHYLSKGVYFIKVKFSNGLYETIKFVII